MRWFFFLSLPLPSVSYTASPQASLGVHVSAGPSPSFGFLLGFTFLTGFIVEVNVSEASGGRRTRVHLLLSQVCLSKHAAGDKAEAPGATFHQTSRKDRHLTQARSSLKSTNKELLVTVSPRPGSFLLSPTQVDQSSRQHKPKY